MERVYKISQFAERLNTTPATLRYWDKIGRLKAFRTNTGQRYYTETQAVEYFQDMHTGVRLPNDAVIYIRADTEVYRNIIKAKYLRKYLEILCFHHNFKVIKVYIDYCYEDRILSPENKFMTAITQVLTGHVHHLIIPVPFGINIATLKNMAQMFDQVNSTRIHVVPVELPDGLSGDDVQRLQWSNVIMDKDSPMYEIDPNCVDRDLRRLKKFQRDAAKFHQ